MKILDNSLVKGKNNHQEFFFRTSRSLKALLGLARPSIEFDVLIRIDEGQISYRFSNFKFCYYQHEALKVESDLEEIRRNNWGELMPDKKQELIRKGVDVEVNSIFENFRMLNEDC